MVISAYLRLVNFPRQKEPRFPVFMGKGLITLYHFKVLSISNFGPLTNNRLQLIPRTHVCPQHGGKLLWKTITDKTDERTIMISS